MLTTTKKTKSKVYWTDNENADTALSWPKLDEETAETLAREIDKVMCEKNARGELTADMLIRAGGFWLGVNWEKIIGTASRGRQRWRARMGCYPCYGPCITRDERDMINAHCKK